MDMVATGVYGDRQGASVNEDTPPAPESDRAVRRLAAETALRAWAEARARLSASAWSFPGKSRRVDNRRMREELGVALAYQDLDEGIRTSL